MSQQERDSDAEGGLPLEELASLPEFYQATASHAGDRIAFYYDGTGRNELYVEDVETGERRQVSDGNVPRDAGSPIAWDRGDDRLFFHDEEGGDEQYDVAAIDLDTGETETVVEAPGQTVLQDVGPDGRYLLYSSTKSGQMNLHRFDTATGEEVQVTDYEQPVVTADLSPDGERVAYSTNESANLENRDVYVGAADGSDARKLPVGDDGVETVVSGWSPDGDVLLVGDESEDLGRCGLVDPEDGSVEWYGDGDYEESPGGFLPDGSGFVASRMVECGTVPVVYDRETGAARELGLDAGVAGLAGGWGGPSGGYALADGDLLFTYTTPESRQELYRYDPATDESEVLVEADYGEFDPETFVGAEFVTYQSTGTDETFGVEGEAYEIEGLLYEAEGDGEGPGIVSVHGGPHARAGKRFSFYTQYLVSRGYTVFQPNYRGSVGRGREFKNSIHHDWGGLEQEDVAEAGRWLEDHEGVDAERVAVMGGSYGGYSAYMQLVKHPDLWATAVARVGITHLPSLMEESMPHFKTVLRQQLGDPEENADLWEERSPLTHVENAERPILMLHGINDPRCPISQARQFRDALEGMGWADGEDFVYEELGEEGHGSTDIDQKIRAYRTLTDYLDDWL